jgi:hypothetical protein
MMPWFAVVVGHWRVIASSAVRGATFGKSKVGLRSWNQLDPNPINRWSELVGCQARERAFG